MGGGVMEFVLPRDSGGGGGGGKSHTWRSSCGDRTKL